MENTLIRGEFDCDWDVLFEDINNPMIYQHQLALGQIKPKYEILSKDKEIYFSQSSKIYKKLREYIKKKRKGKYGAYHLGFCAHYVGDLSQPLHNTLYNLYNWKNHKTIDGIIDEEVLKNIQRIKIYPITINSEKDLAKEIARIANLAIELGYRIEAEDRLLTKEEAYTQISHSVSLFKAILGYVEKRD